VVWCLLSLVCLVVTGNSVVFYYFIGICLLGCYVCFCLFCLWVGYFLLAGFVSLLRLIAGVMLCL